MKRDDKVWYIGMLILSVVLAGTCVFQIIQRDVLHAVAAAIGFVITFYCAIDGLVFVYFERLHKLISSQQKQP